MAELSNQGLGIELSKGQLPSQRSSAQEVAHNISSFERDISPTLSLAFSIIQSPGSAQIVGDLALCRNNTFTIADSTGKVHTGVQAKDFRYNNQNIEGELWIKNISADFLNSDHPVSSPKELALQLNDLVASQLVWQGFNPEENHTTPGIVAAIGKYTAETLSIASWGDVRVIVELKNGSLISTENQLYDHDHELAGRALELGSRASNPYFWEQFAPILAEKRQEHANNPHHQKGYGVLNGQHGFEHFIETIEVPLSSVARVFIATDGLMKFNDHSLTYVQEKLLMKMVDSEHKLVSHYFDMREQHRQEAKSSYIDYPEATALLMSPVHRQ